MRDLFGNEVAFDPNGPALTAKERRKLKHGRISPLPRGHAAPPGTGPVGETCGSCEHLVRRTLSKAYLKCDLTRDRWTGGGASDVRARDAACKVWEKAE